MPMRWSRGVTRNSFDVLDEVSRVIDVKPGSRDVRADDTARRASAPLLLADTLVHETPSPAQLADIAMQAAAKAHELGLVPRVALLSYSNFGNPTGPDGERVRQAVALLDQRRLDFEYDGEMSADVALDAAADAPALPVLPARRRRPTFWSCRNCTAPTSRQSCCRISAAGRSSGRC